MSERGTVVKWAYATGKCHQVSPQTLSFESNRKPILNLSRVWILFLKFSCWAVDDCLRVAAERFSGLGVGGIFFVCFKAKLTTVHCPCDQL